LESSGTPSKEEIIKFNENRIQKAIQEERKMYETNMEWGSNHVKKQRW